MKVLGKEPYPLIYQRQVLDQLNDPNNNAPFTDTPTNIAKPPTSYPKQYYSNSGLIVPLRSLEDVALLPPGSLILSRAAHRQKMQERLELWSPKEQVWPLLHGANLAMVGTGLSGYYIGLFARTHFQIISQRLGASILFTAGVTAFANYLLFRSIIVEPAIGPRNTALNCNLCTSLRAGCLQVFCGTLFPAVMSIFGGLAMAKMERTYPVPPLTDYRKLLEVSRLCLTACRKPMLITGVLHLAFGLWLGDRVGERANMLILDDVHQNEKLYHASPSSISE